jgi:hypothetical protein
MRVVTHKEAILKVLGAWSFSLIAVDRVVCKASPELGLVPDSRLLEMRVPLSPYSCFTDSDSGAFDVQSSHKSPIVLTTHVTVSHHAVEIGAVCDSLRSRPGHPRRMKVSKAILLVAALTCLGLLKNARHLRRIGSRGSSTILRRGTGNSTGHRSPALSNPFLDEDVLQSELLNNKLDSRHRPYGTERSGASFSACLMWMDDNFLLPEWIAYHYYTMNLRYLVVHPDPRSKTSPSHVLDKWKDRMTIVEWSPANNFSTFNIPTSTNDSLTRKVELLVRRQVHFYQSCALYLRSRNRTWTSFHDSDEYIVVRPLPSLLERQRQPGAIPTIVETYASRGYNQSTSDIPTGNATSENGVSFWHHWFSDKPCMTFPRVLFGAVPSPHEDVTREVPSFVDARQFSTLNWRYRATPPGATDGLAKSIMDVSRIPSNVTVDVWAGSPHRPFDSMCSHAFPRRDSLPLVIHHYLGSWEAFSFRDDARRGGLRTVEKWQQRSALRYGDASDDARPWIRGFVDCVGEDAAAALLQDAGLPRGYRMTQDETAAWSTLPPGN